MTFEDDNPFDLSKPSLTDFAASGHAFAIPWIERIQPVLSGFQSARIMDKAGPWVHASPFDEQAVQACNMVFESNGGSCTYRDAMSSAAHGNSEHMSVSGSLSVGPPFLKAEASGQYDKSVSENENGIQSSRVASHRIGRLIVHNFPRYSEEAKRLLASTDGRKKFSDTYGDYFVRGFVLGADAGICLSAHSNSKDSTEQLKVKVTVKVLFVEKSAEHEEMSENHEASAELKVCGYSTVFGQSEALETRSTAYSEQQRIRSIVTKYTRVVTELEPLIKARMAELKLKEGADVKVSQVYDIYRSGLVVQLLLFPHARTYEYMIHV